MLRKKEAAKIVSPFLFNLKVLIMSLRHFTSIQAERIHIKEIMVKDDDLQNQHKANRRYKSVDYRQSTVDSRHVTYTLISLSLSLYICIIYFSHIYFIIIMRVVCLFRLKRATDVPISIKQQ